MPADADLLDLTAEIVAAHASRSPVDIEQLPELIRSVHRAFAALASGRASAPAEQKQPAPAVPIQHSVTPDYIVCLECGVQTVILKRHLARHGLRPEAYRARWSLPGDYPLVASTHSKRRSAFAKQIGLGSVAQPARTPTAPARIELGGAQDVE